MLTSVRPSRFAECPPGSFKDAALDNKCKPCPANTQRQAAGALFCPCMDGFYRAASDPPSGPCSGKRPRHDVMLQHLDIKYRKRIFSSGENEELSSGENIPGVEGVATRTSPDKLALKQCEHVEAAACKVSKKKCTEVEVYSNHGAVFST